MSNYCKFGCGPQDLHPECRIHTSQESFDSSGEHLLTQLLVLLALFAAAWVVIVMVIAPAPAQAAPEPRVHLQPCLSDEGESAFPCAWLASHMGNKKGHSFRIFKDGRVRLISHARAFALLGECDSNGPLYCRSQR